MTRKSEELLAVMTFVRLGVIIKFQCGHCQADGDSNIYYKPLTPTEHAQAVVRLACSLLDRGWRYAESYCFVCPKCIAQNPKIRERVASYGT